MKKQIEQLTLVIHMNILVLRCKVLPVPFTIHLSLLKSKFALYWEDYWKKEVANTDTGKFLFNIRGGSIKKHLVIFNLLTRREQVLIQRLRIGHTGLQHYLHRFKIIQDDALTAALLQKL